MTIMDTPSRKHPRKMYRMVNTTSNMAGASSQPSTTPARAAGTPVKPIEIDKNAAPIRIKLIMHEVRTAPIRLAMKEALFKLPLTYARNNAPNTPIVAASVGVAYPP